MLTSYLNEINRAFAYVAFLKVTWHKNSPRIWGKLVHGGFTILAVRCAKGKTWI